MKKKALVLLSIILVCLLIWSLVVPNVSVNTPENVVQSQLAVFRAGLELYRQKNGSYPSTDKGLKILLAGEPDESILEKDVELVDKWGNELIYRFPGTCERATYDLYSTGENLNDECGSGDDVISAMQ